MVSEPRRHETPRWVLTNFRRPYLYELDIFTGKAELRAPEIAASEPGLWPDDIEAELSVHDNLAAQIYRKKLKRTKVVLSSGDRDAFSLWLAKFYIRAPKRRRNAMEYLAECKTRPAVIREVLDRNRHRIVSEFCAKAPELYSETRRSPWPSLCG